MRKRKSIIADETGMQEKQTKLRSRREICVKGFQGRSP